MHHASFNFDHEQHVIAAQAHGVDGEEVGGHDALGLGAEEFSPGRTRSPWRWRKPMVSQHVRDAALGDRDAELLELPDNAQVAPAREMLSSTFPPLCRAGNYVELSRMSQ